MKKYSVIIAVVLALVLATAAAAQDRLSVYVSFEEPLARIVFEEFEKDTGIKVDWIRLSTGEALARIDAEKNNPQASVWYGGVGLNHIDAKNKGLTEPYESPNAKAIPDQFKDPDHYWTGIYAGALGFVSNLDRLEELGAEPPKSWKDLLDPKFRDEIQMANPGSSGTAYNVIATLVQIWGEDEAFAYLKELDKNIQQYTRSGGAPFRAASIGEITIGINYSHDIVKLIADGYPVTLTFPEEGTGYEVASISLIKGGPNPELARTLVDWALSERAAQIFADWYLTPFVKANLQPGAIAIQELNVIDQDDIWAAQEKDRLTERWNNEIYR
ncbi:MAG TPA: ABC transporter substrate-binding protein [Firmicutes bacterium]|jgi:iron(III) transport system substrate-binding protein|nr:MAG: iron ABC transporter substrate-binding protein [Peptococcaceae bacterium 1109]HHT73403.1 ABC transporter substrate-binding protein [Bacillota bacterium]